MRFRIALVAGAVAGRRAAVLHSRRSPRQPTAAAKAATVTNGCLASVPEPGSTAPVKICYSLFRPAGADRAAPGADDHAQPRLGRLADHRPGVVPEVAGRGVRRAVVRPARLRRERRAGPRREPGLRGPRRAPPDRADREPALGEAGRARATRGWARSAAATAAATSSWRRSSRCAPGQAGLRRARPRDHVVRPQPEPGARGRRPHRVGARAQRRRGCRPTRCRRTVYKALVEGAATGTWPDGSIPGTENMVAFFRKNGPKWHVDHGRRLDIPVLFGQGTTDSLFNLQQGLANWRHALTAVRPQGEHLRRLQRRPRAAVGAAAGRRRSPPTRAASGSPAAPSPTSRCGS